MNQETHMDSVDIKVWRIAGILCVICSVALLALFIYQLAEAENPKTFANLRRDATQVILLFVLLNTMLAGLVTFPYYWVTGIMRRFRPSGSLSDGRRYRLGLLASCGCIALVLWLKGFL
jgi:hypothetical protein